MTNILFEKSNTQWQGGKLTLTFEPATDRTVYDYVKNYRYRFNYYPLYWSSGGSNQYAFYNITEKNSNDWIKAQDLVIDEDELISLPIIIPSYDNDMVVTVSIEAEDDASSTYVSYQETEPFVAFYHKTPTISMNRAVWVDEDNFSVVAKIIDSGIIKPANTIGSKTDIENYSRAFMNTGLIGAIAYEWRIPSADIVYRFAQVENALSTGDWYSGSVLSVDKISKNEQMKVDQTYSVAFSYKFSYEEDYTSSNFTPLPPLTSGFQVRKYGVIAFMSKTLKVFKGGGIFNKNAQNDDSIALYDLTTNGTNYNNNPSVGFYDNDHKLLARIKYENGALKTEGAKWEDSEHVIKWVDLD
jgi:hypothetical protein